MWRVHGCRDQIWFGPFGLFFSFLAGPSPSLVALTFQTAATSALRAALLHDFCFFYSVFLLFFAAEGEQEQGAMSGLAGEERRS